MELRIRFTIQLKFIYSICQTLYHWPGRGITPAFRTEESRKLALPLRCRTSAHRPRIAPGNRSFSVPDFFLSPLSSTLGCANQDRPDRVG